MASDREEQWDLSKLYSPDQATRPKTTPLQTGYGIDTTKPLRWEVTQHEDSKDQTSPEAVKRSNLEREQRDGLRAADDFGRE